MWLRWLKQLQPNRQTGGGQNWLTWLLMKVVMGWEGRWGGVMRARGGEERGEGGGVRRGDKRSGGERGQEAWRWDSG